MIAGGERVGHVRREIAECFAKGQSFAFSAAWALCGVDVEPEGFDYWFDLAADTYSEQYGTGFGRSA